MKHNFNYILLYIFVQFAFFKLKTLIDTEFNWNILSDFALKNLIRRFYNEKNYYVDRNSCLLANIQYFKVSTPTWFYICSKFSLKKYKVLIIPKIQKDNIDTNNIFVSETMKYNIENALHCTVDKCFLCKYILKYYN